MRINFEKIPFDIILCMICSFIFIPLALLESFVLIRLIIGLPFIIIIPGYLVLSALYPTRKSDSGIDNFQRLIISIGLSFAIISLIGLILNYTPFGIKIQPYLLSLLIFIIIISIIGIYRWFNTNLENRYKINLTILRKKSKNNINKVLNLILIGVIFISISSIIYAIATPENNEKFTSFYILGNDKIANNYERYSYIGEEITFTIGLNNHENEKIKYTIEVWLINQHITSNLSQLKYDNMWFLEKINITLDHKPIELEKTWEPQWQYDFVFTVKEEFKGNNLKIAFLLFKEPTKKYEKYEDYKDITKEKINNAYRSLLIPLDVI